MLIKNVTYILLLIITIAACAPAPRFTSDGNDASDITARKDPSSRFSSEDDVIVFTTEVPNDSTSADITYKDFNVLETVTGIASFYADAFHGKTTYNGETYDMYGLTAAHPTYPMGTKMIVTNLGNGKSVEIRINDRMPQHPDRIIDLSLGTARALGMEKAGLANVMLEITEWGKGRE